MKNVGIILIGVAVAIVAGAVTYAAFNPSNPADSATSEAEFLDSIRADSKPAASAGEAPGSLPPAGTEGGIAKISVKETHDMGIIKNDQISTQYVAVRNTGDAPLRISRVTTSCGCTQGEMEKDVVSPGEEARLVVTVDPARIPKFYSEKILTIFSNDPQNGAVRLPVIARVDPEVEWETDMIDFGEIPKGESAEKSFVIRQLQEKPFEITSADVIGAQNVYSASFALSDSSTWKDPNKREYVVTVKTDPNASVGHHPAKLQVRTDLARFSGRGMFFELTAEVVGVYKLHPMRVTLKDLVPGQDQLQVLKVSAETEFEITDFKSTNQAMKVEHHPGDDPNTVIFDLTIAEGTTERLQRDTWELTIAAKGETYVERVPVLAILRNTSGGHSAAPAPQPGQPDVTSRPDVTPNPTPESLRAEHKKAGAKTGDSGQ